MEEQGQNRRRMTAGEKGEVKMLIRSQATDGEQLCVSGGGVDQRTVGVAHDGQTFI